MVYTDELVRVTLRWSPPAAFSDWALEEAVTTFHLRHHHITGNGFTWSDQMTHLPSQLYDKINTHWAGGYGSAVVTGAGITQIKVAHLDPAGHTLDEGAMDVTDGSLNATGGPIMMPPEVAVCVSAWAYPPGGFASNKGRKRGRFYLPYLASGTLAQHGRLSTAFTSSLATASQALFNDIQGMHTFNEDTPPDPNPDYWDFVVASKVDASWHNVDFVSVDDIYDSQRRRQHKTVPVRNVLPITHA